MPHVDINSCIPIPLQKGTGTQTVLHGDDFTGSDDEFHSIERPDEDLSEDLNELDAIIHEPYLRRSTPQTAESLPARLGLNSACVATDSKGTLHNTCINLTFSQAMDSAERTKWHDAMEVEFDTLNDLKT